MPDLTTLTSKALQLNALRDIRQFASSSYKILNKSKDVLKELLREMQPSRNRGMNLEIQSQQDTQRNNGSSYSYQQSNSVAEQTIRQYTQGSTQITRIMLRTIGKW